MNLVKCAKAQEVESVRILRGMLNTDQEISEKLGMTLEHVEHIIEKFIKTARQSGG